MEAASQSKTGYGLNACNGYESWSRIDVFRAALRDIRCEIGK